MPSRLPLNHAIMKDTGRRTQTGRRTLGSVLSKHYCPRDTDLRLRNSLQLHRRSTLSIRTVVFPLPKLAGLLTRMSEDWLGRWQSWLIHQGHPTSLKCSRGFSTEDEEEKGAFDRALPSLQFRIVSYSSGIRPFLLSGASILFLAFSFSSLILSIPMSSSC